jgi:hypothetical protein
MTRSRKALLVSFLLLLIVSTALSQQPGPTTAKEQKRQRQRLQAISMVEQTASEAPLWNDKKAGVQALADAADLLWDETPGQGAKWLAKAWALIDQVTEPTKNERLKEFFNPSERAALQTIVLNVAGKHDAQLAEKFLKQLTEKDPEEKKERGAFDDKTARSEQLLRLAQQVVDTSPEQALSLAARSLADGISYSLQNVLTSLRKKNVALANQLFDLALTRFSSSVAEPSEGEVLAGYLFKSGLTFSANSSGQTILVVNPEQQNQPAVAKSEPQRAKNFLVAAYQAFLNRPIQIDTSEGRQRAQKVLVFGNRIVGYYNTHAPEFAVPARAFLAQLQSEVSPGGETGPFGGANRSNSGGENTTKARTKEERYETRLAELEERADKETNPIFKKLAYVEAALAPTPQDYQRAKRIAEKIADDNLRADAVSFVLYRAALFFLEEDEIETAGEIAPQITDGSRRAVVRIAIGQRLLATRTAEKIDPAQLTPGQQRVFDLLSDVERDLKKEEPSLKVVKILLGRTALLAKLDPVQSFVSLEQAVEMINKLERFDPKDGAAPDLSLGVSEISGATVATPRVGFNFRSAIEPLIKTDLEQISAVVERLRAKSVRGVARLEVARLYFQKNR